MPGGGCSVYDPARECLTSLRAQIYHSFPFLDTFQIYLQYNIVCTYHVQCILKYVSITEWSHPTNALPPSYRVCEETLNSHC